MKHLLVYSVEDVNSPNDNAIIKRREFDDEPAMWMWIRVQDSHPYLRIKIIEHKDINEDDD